jgi:hypothetical protein
MSRFSFHDRGLAIFLTLRKGMDGYLRLFGLVAERRGNMS